MKKKIDYEYIDKTMRTPSVRFKFNLKDYCESENLNYKSVKSGLSRYRRNIVEEENINPFKIGDNARLIDDDRVGEITEIDPIKLSYGDGDYALVHFSNLVPVKRYKIPKEKRDAISKAGKKMILRIPTYNDLAKMMESYDHFDSEYWDKHNVKNRALIDRVLNWVRDFQTSKKL